MQLPEKFAERMKALLGEEYEEFLQSYERPQAQGLRVNTQKLSTETFRSVSPFSLEPVPWTPEGFYYGEKDRPGKHPFHEAGLYYIQEPSAMAVGTLAQARPGERVLDLCAAPGGKTTHLAAQLRGEGLLVSNEIHPARAKILAQNVERMGISNAVVTNEKPERLAERFPEFFDRIVVDAPCSGEGMFRKEAEAALQWSEDNVRMCARRQAGILDCAAAMLRPGGTLVYSTCTFAPEENEGSISAFLERHPDFSAKRRAAYEGFGAGRPDWAGGDERTADTFRLWPHRLRGEGHYAAVLVRAGGMDGSAQGLPFAEGRGGDYGAAGGQPESGRRRSGRQQRRRTGESVPKTDPGVLKLYERFAGECLNSRPQGVPVQFGSELYLLPVPLELDGLKVLRAGLHVGTVRRDRLEPAHALALALEAGQAKRVFELTSGEDQAERYLRGEALAADGADGWTLVLYRGYPLGWGKQTGNVLKNHYPKGLRRG